LCWVIVAVVVQVVRYFFGLSFGCCRVRNFLFLCKRYEKKKKEMKKKKKKEKEIEK
jgi:uncharacterized protein YacL